LAIGRKVGVVVRQVSNSLNEDDIFYLARRYDLREDHVRGMDDFEWCHFIGCTLKDLPYYLFEETDDEIMFDLPEITVPDSYIQGLRKAPVVPITSAKKQAQGSLFHSDEYKTPSPMSKKTKKRVIKHYFQIIK